MSMVYLDVHEGTIQYETVLYDAIQYYIVLEDAMQYYTMYL